MPTAPAKASGAAVIMGPAPPLEDEDVGDAVSVLRSIVCPLLNVDPETSTVVPESWAKMDVADKRPATEKRIVKRILSMGRSCGCGFVRG